MRITLLVILTFLSLSSPGQISAGQYQDYSGCTLVLNEDSTFRYDWGFDLMHTWATGQWSTSGRFLHLKFIMVYDTLIRDGKPDSLVLSFDETAQKITQADFELANSITCWQGRERFSNKFCLKRNRLYIIDDKGRLYKKRHRHIWPQRRWLWGFKKWPTWYIRTER